MHNAMAVAIGDYDGSVVCSEFAKKDNNSKIAKRLRILALTDPIVGWIFTLTEKFPKEKKKKIIKAMLKLAPGSYLAKKILKLSPWAGFVKPRGDELKGIGKLIKKYNVPQSL